MSFANTLKKANFTGAGVAYTAPFAAYKGTQIALNTITAGTTVSSAGAVLNCANPGLQIEWDSLHALIETDLTTSTITATPKWQVSPDGAATTWVDYVGVNAAANVTKAAAGTGSLITTQWVQGFPGMNPAFPFIRIAVLVGVVTGGAGDNVTVSYFFKNRVLFGS
jgi:hypothetical protein